MSRSIIALAVAVTMAVAPATSAAADFDFFGSGSGHGIGLSQYGALGLAQAGWGAERIVEHYFRKGNVSPHQPPDPKVKVGLLQHRSSVKLVAVAGSFELEMKSGAHVDTVPSGQSRTISIHSGQYRVKRPNGEVVGGLWGGSGNHLYARRNGGRINVPAWGHQIGRGDLQFDIVGASSAHLVAVVPVEQYVYGVSEVSTSWPLRAQRAQAILARSYAYWRLAGPPRSGCSCDVFPSSVDQYYVAWTKESSPGGGKWVTAVNQTHHKVFRYNGNYVYTPYSSSSGGHTENIQNVWPGAAPAPWLKGVCDPRDDVGGNPSTTWHESFTAGQVTNALGLGIGTVQEFTNYNRGVSGRVTTVKVVGGSGSKVVQGWTIRSALGLKDTRFAVDENLNITGYIRDEYDREDCKPGRAVAPKQDITGGAYQRFLNGRVYRNGPADTETWVRGAVFERYLAEGAHNGALGLPVNFQTLQDGTKGVFDHGTIVCGGGCTVNYD